LEEKKIFSFLFVSTLISGILGLVFLKLIIDIENQIELSGNIITFIIGSLLIFTAYLQIKKNENGNKKFEDLKVSDGIVLGIGQGFAALPGISRSGITVALLLLKKFNEEAALKLSFIMSIPIVLAGNVLLNIEYFKLSLENFVAFIFSFVFGLLTIHYLIKFAQRFNLGYFVFVFGFLMVLSILI